MTYFTKKRMAFAVTGFVALSLAVGAVAQGKGKRFNFDALDVNQDGFVTQTEIDTARKARFDDQDSNGDGVVTKDELLTAIKARAATKDWEVDEERLEKRVNHMFEKMDSDSDGKIVFAELGSQRGTKMFEKLDANNDGKISKEEAKKVRKKRKGKDKGSNESE